MNAAPPLPLVDAALRGMVLALALLLAALLRRWPGPQPAAVRAAGWLCLGLAVQALGSSPWAERSLDCAWQTPLVGIAVGNAVTFWLFTAALFDDAFRWRPWHLAAWAAAVAIGAVQCPAFVWLDEGLLRGSLRVALRTVTLAAGLGAAWTMLRHWRSDLVESRRRLRLWLVAAGVVYSLAQLSARLSTPTGLLTPGLAVLEIGLLLAVLGGWALSSLRFVDGGPLEAPRPASGQPGAASMTSPAAGPGEPTATRAAPPAAEPREPGDVDPGEPIDPALADSLHRAMDEERAYRDDALTVASLAARLRVPEYRLRRHINRHLGFRNFNTYVNGFRLADARRWLADPANRDTPILTIALDAGFGSIGPFNRAFKADTGLTPSEYRQRAVAGR